MQVSNSILRDGAEAFWPVPWLRWDWDGDSLRHSCVCLSVLFPLLDFSDYIRTPPGNADFSPSALKFLCNELINWNHGAKEVLPSITWLSSDRRGKVTNRLIIALPCFLGWPQCPDLIFMSLCISYSFHCFSLMGTLMLVGKVIHLGGVRISVWTETAELSFVLFCWR